MQCYILAAINVFAFIFLGELCIRRALHNLLSRESSDKSFSWPVHANRISVTQGLGNYISGEYLAVAMNDLFDAISWNSFVTPRGSYWNLVFHMLSKHLQTKD